MVAYTLKQIKMILRYAIFFSMVSAFVYVYRSPFDVTKPFKTEHQPNVIEHSESYNTKSLIKIDLFQEEVMDVLLRSLERVRLLSQAVSTFDSNETRTRKLQTLYDEALFDLKSDVVIINSYSDNELLRHSQIKAALLQILKAENFFTNEYHLLILDEGNKSNDKNNSFYQKELQYLKKFENLRKLYEPIPGKTEIAQIGAISANNDKSVGDLIADAMDKVGKDGIITIEEAYDGDDNR